MLKSEFEERVKMQVNPEEWDAIQIVYNNAEVDKDEFCKMWAKMNLNRIKAAVEKSKKQQEEAKLKEKCWHILEKLNKIRCQYKWKFAIDFLSSRDCQTLSQAGLYPKEEDVWQFTGRLRKYLTVQM